MLNDNDKRNPFRVPENYFENFNLEIMDKLPEKAPSVKKVPLWRSITTWSAAAAVFVAVSLVGINYLESNNSHPTTIESGSTTDTTASLENDYYDFIEEEATLLAYKDSFYE